MIYIYIYIFILYIFILYYTILYIIYIYYTYYIIQYYILYIYIIYIYTTYIIFSTDPRLCCCSRSSCRCSSSCSCRCRCLTARMDWLLAEATAEWEIHHLQISQNRDDIHIHIIHYHRWVTPTIYRC